VASISSQTAFRLDHDPTFTVHALTLRTADHLTES
jgi:hypothetical protein